MQKRIGLQKLTNKNCWHYILIDKKINYEEIIKVTKYYRNIITEEHISFIQKPGSTYIAHTTTENGFALEIKKGRFIF